MGSVYFKPEQREAIERLSNGCILCAKVGTGKSITALGYYYIRECRGVVWDDGNIGPIIKPMDLYIITTARKRDDKEWESECDRFDLMTEPDISVTIDSWNNLHKYENVENAFFIFDEQRVVGSGAWVKAFLRVTKKNDWILLSATPGDKWLDYIPVFVANGFYKNRSAFLRRHAVYSRWCTKYPKIEKIIETNHLERLRRQIMVTMKSEKKTVPHWNDIIVTYDRKLYDVVWKKRWDPWKEEPIQDISAACYLMRRAANDNEIRARELFWLVVSKHPKAIVFYNYDYELELIKKTFEEMAQIESTGIGPDDISIAEWNGHKHEPIPDNRRWIYLVQYMAGAEGWNCIETDTIIFFSQNYSYKLMEQAAGRIDRMNTPFVDLYYYVFKTEAPIDKAIALALKNKKNFNERLFIRFEK